MNKYEIATKLPANAFKYMREEGTILWKGSNLDDLTAPQECPPSQESILQSGWSHAVLTRQWSPEPVCTCLEIPFPSAFWDTLPLWHCHSSELRYLPWSCVRRHLQLTELPFISRELTCNSLFWDIHIPTAVKSCRCTSPASPRYISEQKERWRRHLDKDSRTSPLLLWPSSYEEWTGMAGLSTTAVQCNYSYQ